jgi:hypothetical protein
MTTRKAAEFLTEDPQKQVQSVFTVPTSLVGEMDMSGQFHWAGYVTSKSYSVAATWVCSVSTS